MCLPRCMLLLGATVLFLHSCHGLACYNCSGKSSVSQCNVTINCQDGEACYLQRSHGLSGLEISLGCQSFQLCGGGGAHSGANMIGRELEDSYMYTRQVTSDCHECCTRDYCNQDLCFHPKPSACIDKASVDCAELSTLLNICADRDHAKTICPKFCGLCTVVDGEWSLWSTWSSCDVTCSNGTRNRDRTCTNPAPSNSGSDCVGNNHETETCTKPKCPVHGGWSLWSPWGECSVTCDVGIQRRDRACSNPYPDLSGDHCFGESRDDRICMNRTCIDGGWSEWGTWGQCNTDGGYEGVKTRHRNCSNPLPSAFGRMCIGTDEETAACTNITVGIVGFHVNHVREFIANVPVFDQVLLNEGGGYNTSTGYFTAPSAGMYRFTGAMCAISGSNFYFGITKGPSSKFSWLTSKHIYTYRSVSCGESSAITRLSVGEQVSVRVVNGYTSYHYQNSVIISTFTGTKLSP